MWTSMTYYVDEKYWGLGYCLFWFQAKMIQMHMNIEQIFAIVPHQY